MTYSKITIDEIQAELRKLGWQWIEHIFNDGMSECYIILTQDKSPHALTTFPRPDDCMGWGRFNRHYCWHCAYDRIVLGLKDANLTPSGRIPTYAF